MKEVDTEGLRLTTVELAGDPVAAVIAYAKQIAADLVVVARHGRRYGMYWRSGVYARELARAIARPTLAVPDGGSPGGKGPFVNILCPTDFSAASDAALRQALILAQQHGGRLTLLHVLEGFPSETAYSGGAAFRQISEYRARVDKIARDLRSAVSPDVFNWCDVDIKVVSGVAHRSILATASEIGADLIVMGMPARTGLDRVVMASTAPPVLRGAACPVLMVTAAVRRDGSHAGGEAVASVETSELVAGLALASR
jgi:nucleotide-binding universal stress UspA family protein